MDQPSSLLRSIPGIDQLLKQEQVQSMIEAYSPALVTQALREALDELREGIISGAVRAVSQDEILMNTAARLAKAQTIGHRPVINATGVLLHTNLGRALMAEKAGEAAKQAAINYTNLEFDCQTGKRGDRLVPIVKALKALTGAEDALVVNNNAAAVLLALSALAKGRQVIVSRGELVEIGGSFRVPDVMTQSGCQLVEVGTTNKTKLADYEQAICENTAALMKVHTSNYQIIGFTQSADMADIARLACERSLISIYDLGSGAMLPLAPYGLKMEPLVKDALAQGADVVCFSGDKLLGGPQAGIILGKAEYIAIMKKHPLMRALRADKMSLAALEATLLLYQDEELARRELPLYRMLEENLDALKTRAESLNALLDASIQAYARIVPSDAQVGGGSAPGEMLPSLALTITPGKIGLNELYMRLIQAETPVIARVHQDSLLLDMRTLRDKDVKPLADALNQALTREVSA